MKSELQEIYRLIVENDIITIFGHGLPDGDCYGCQIGLREIIRSAFPNKKVYAVGSGLPSMLGRIATMDSIDLKTIQKSLAILVDVSCLRRVEDQRVLQAHSFAKFDHHMFNPGEEFAYPSYVDSTKVSCAEIIAEFGFEFGFTFNRAAAEALYVGIVTDSGHYKYFGTTQETLHVVAELFPYGIEPKSLLAILFNEDEATKAFEKWMLRHAEIDGQVASLFLKREDYLKKHLSYEHASNMVNVLEKLGTNIFCLFTVDEKGDVRGELRSKIGYPVQPVAMKYGGGGHLFAAGLTLVQQKPDYHEVVNDLNKVEYVPEVHP